MQMGMFLTVRYSTYFFVFVIAECVAPDIMSAIVLPWKSAEFVLVDKFRIVNSIPVCTLFYSCKPHQFIS